MTSANFAGHRDGSSARTRRRARRCRPRPGARPCAACQAAATRGSAISAAMCGRLAMPIGPRASSTVMLDAELGERLDEDAHRRQRAMIDDGAGPVEDDGLQMPQALVMSLSSSAEQVGDHLLGDGEGGAGAGAAGDHDQADRVGRAVDEHRPVGRRGVGAGPALDDRRARAEPKTASNSSRISSSTAVGREGVGRRARSDASRRRRASRRRSARRSGARRSRAARAARPRAGACSAAASGSAA